MPPLPPPSPFVVAGLRLAPPGRVLDVACGAGRHAKAARALGHPVVAVDRDTAAIAAWADADPGIAIVTADLEGGPWPFAGEEFAAVVVSNYLWRPRFADLLAAVEPGGLLIYETFAGGHERLGRPRRPEFLLQAGELRRVVDGAFEVLRYEHGPEGEPVHSVRQRILARRR